MGFTLVEMLVVIAVIAMLAAFLFPAARGIQDRSKTTKCASNQRQLGAASLLYAAENEGKLPPYSHSSVNLAWYQCLAPYIGAVAANSSTIGSASERIVICPAAPSFGASGVNSEQIGYGWNFIGLSMIDFTDYTGWVTGSTVTVAQVEQPSKTVMLADSPDPSTSTLRYVTAPKEWEGSTYIGIYRPAGIHGGKANALFCDGHVEYMALANTGAAGNPTTLGLHDVFWWKIKK